MTEKLTALNLAQFENKIAEGYQVIDMRPAAQFAEGYIPGAIYGAGSFISAGTLKKLLPASTALLIITEGGEEEDKALQLRKAGFKIIGGYLQGGFDTWRQSGNGVDVVISVDAEEIMLDIKYGSPHIVDLRSQSAFDFLHLETAEHVEMASILGNINILPSDQIYYLYDEDGEKAMTVVSWLKKNNLHNFYHIQGGYRHLQDNEAGMKSNNTPDGGNTAPFPPESLN